MIYHVIKVRSTQKYFFVRTYNSLHYPLCGNNCQGHNSEEEARQHFLEYCLNHALYAGVSSDIDVPCEICQAKTRNIIRTGPELAEWHYLCDEHRGKEELAQVMGTVDFIQKPDLNFMQVIAEKASLIVPWMQKKSYRQCTTFSASRAYIFPGPFSSLPLYGKFHPHCPP